MSVHDPNDIPAASASQLGEQVIAPWRQYLEGGVSADDFASLLEGLHGIAPVEGEGATLSGDFTPIATEQPQYARDFPNNDPVLNLLREQLGRDIAALAIGSRGFHAVYRPAYRPVSSQDMTLGELQPASVEITIKWPTVFGPDGQHRLRRYVVTDGAGGAMGKRVEVDASRQIVKSIDGPRCLINFVECQALGSIVETLLSLGPEAGEEVLPLLDPKIFEGLVDISELVDGSGDNP